MPFDQLCKSFVLRRLKQGECAISEQVIAHANRTDPNQLDW